MFSFKKSYCVTIVIGVTYYFHGYLMKRPTVRHLSVKVF